VEDLFADGRIQVGVGLVYVSAWFMSWNCVCHVLVYGVVVSWC
jgi:hypothetical protein